MGLLVEPHPQAHPHESQHTDDDEGHLPAPGTRQQGNRGRSGQRAHGGTAVEDGGGEGTVLLGEVLGRHLDGGGEVTRLSQGEHHTARQEQVHRHGGDGHGGITRQLSELGHGTVALPLHGRPTAARMETGAQRPYEDGDEIALLGAHPVDELTREEVRDGVEDGEVGRDLTVVGISPVELRGDKVLPGKRQDLTVHVIDGGCQEQQPADDPTEVGHFGSLYGRHIVNLLFIEFVTVCKGTKK